MEKVCYPYSEEKWLAYKCFNDFFIQFPESLSLFFLIFLEISVKKSEVHESLNNKTLSLLVLMILFYFCLITVLFFGIPIDEVSLSEALAYISQLILWVIVTHSFYNYYSEHSFGMTSLYSLKFFVVSRIVSGIYQVVVLSISLSVNNEYYGFSLLVKIFQIVIQTFAVFFSFFVIFSRNPVKTSVLLEEPIALKNSYESASIFSKLTMLWVYPLLKLGSTRPINPIDIDKLREKDSSDYQHSLLKKFVKEVYTDTGTYTLFKVIYKRFFTEIILITLVDVVCTFLEYSSPVFLGLIEDYLNSSEPLWKGIVIAVYLILCKIFRSILGNWNGFRTSLLSNHIKASLSTEIYGKLLRISENSISSGNGSVSYGKIINLIQVDLDNITSGILLTIKVVILPFSLGTGFYLLFMTVQIQAGIAGTITIILLLLGNVSVGRKLSALQKILMEKKDIRMKACNELLGNIRIFKIYNWEKKLSEKILNARENELRQQRSVYMWNTLSIFLSWGSQNYIAIAVIMAMALSGTVLTPANVYLGLSVIRVLRSSMMLLPSIINTFISTKVSLTRIQEYLRSKDQQTYIRNNNDFPISVKNASFAWEIPENAKNGELTETKRILKNISFDVQYNEFVAVVGKVGSGKSSFLQSLIQNLFFLNSEDSYVSIFGSIAYCSQVNVWKNAESFVRRSNSYVLWHSPNGKDIKPTIKWPKLSRYNSGSNDEYFIIEYIYSLYDHLFLCLYSPCRSF